MLTVTCNGWQYMFFTPFHIISCEFRSGGSQKKAAGEPTAFERCFDITSTE
jgi:hypothetical protein